MVLTDELNQNLFNHTHLFTQSLIYTLIHSHSHIHQYVHSYTGVYTELDSSSGDSCVLEAYKKYLKLVFQQTDRGTGNFTDICKQT